MREGLLAIIEKLMGWRCPELLLGTAEKAFCGYSLGESERCHGKATEVYQQAAGGVMR